MYQRRNQGLRRPPRGREMIGLRGNRHDLASMWNASSGRLVDRNPSDRGICPARGDRGETRSVHGRCHLAVHLGNPEQGAYSDLLGIENGPADAALPSTICQASAAALTGGGLRAWRCVFAPGKNARLSLLQPAQAMKASNARVTIRAKLIASPITAHPRPSRRVSGVVFEDIRKHTSFPDRILLPASEARDQGKNRP